MTGSDNSSGSSPSRASTSPSSIGTNYTPNSEPDNDTTGYLGECITEETKRSNAVWDAWRPNYKRTSAERKALTIYSQAILAGIAGNLKKIDPDGKTWVEGDGSPEKALKSIMEHNMDTALFIHHCDLATVPHEKYSNQNPFLMSVLQDQSEVAAEQAVRTYRRHRNNDINFDNAQQWSEYGRNLATLADAQSRHQTTTTGASFVEAPRPPSKLSTQADLEKLKDIIEKLESQIEGVMFVDVSSKTRTDTNEDHEETDSVAQEPEPSTGLLSPEQGTTFAP